MAITFITPGDLSRSFVDIGFAAFVPSGFLASV